MAATPQVGLALGGGVLRGMAHIGVLKVLKKSGIPVHMVAGTSSGSIVAALYASGYTPEQMERIALDLRPGDAFDSASTLLNLFLITGEVITNLLRLPFPFRRPMGLMKGKKLEHLLNSLLGKQRLLSETSIPLGITAVDARDGTLVVFLGGDVNIQTMLPPEDKFVNAECLALAVRASIAVPGIFEPVRLGNRVLVDGGVRENIPAYVLRRMGADIVIAVDVGFDGSYSHRVNSFIDILTQSLEIITSEGINLKLGQYADMVIRPVIKMASWDFDKTETCIKQGELAAEEMVEEIREKLNNYQG